jgi:hypothetical protein
VEKDTAEALLGFFDHRCTAVKKCGKPDNWKQSKYVLPENRIRADADDDTIGTTWYNESEEDDGHDSTGTFEDEDEQGGGGSTSRGQGGSGRGNGRGTGRGSEGRGRGSRRGKGGMRGSKGGPMPGNRLSSTSGRGFSRRANQDSELGEHPSLQSLRKSPEELRSPISAYLNDTTTYSVDGTWMPSRPTVPDVVGYMGSHLEEMSHPLEQNKQ